MSRQTWTAVVAALMFVLLAAVVAVAPVPYVTYVPGETHDLLGQRGDHPVVAVSGVSSFPTSGELRLTTVNVTRPESATTLPEIVHAHLAPDREVFPRWAIYPAGASADELRAEEVESMDTAQADAVAAALRAAGLQVEQVPMVVSVSTTGPAVDRLEPGDFVLEVDGEPTGTVGDVRERIGRHTIGEAVSFLVNRAGSELTVSVGTVASKTQPGAPVVGVNLEMGYMHGAVVAFDLDPAIGGASGGLMLALAVLDRVTPDDLVAGRVVAGSGAIDGSGQVGPVSGIRGKISAAESAGASVFLLPAANCADVTEATRVRLVPVATLEDAVAALDALRDDATADLVKGCR